MEDIEAIERATLAAVPPEAQEEQAGWLLPFDRGTVGRSHSAVPLVHTPEVARAGERIVQRYRESGFAPVLRLPDVPAFEGLQERLAGAGFSATQPTLVQSTALALFDVLPAGAEVVWHDAPDASWADVFLGAGFDPVDGASRLAILGRARGSVFASVRRNGRVVAVGSAGLTQGWCGIHAMRTLPGWRGQGLASAILAALAAAARERGIARAFLQVEEGNAGAQRLYARLGFATRWRYRYWREAGTT